MMLQCQNIHKYICYGQSSFQQEDSSHQPIGLNFKVEIGKKKSTLFTSNLDWNLRKKFRKCYICSIALYGAETWTLQKKIRNTRNALKCGLSFCTLFSLSFVTLNELCWSKSCTKKCTGVHMLIVVCIESGVNWRHALSSLLLNSTWQNGLR